MKNVLIVGVAGFIGSNLAEAHLIQGDKVFGFDNLATGSLRNIVNLQEHPNFLFVEWDLNLGLPTLPPKLDFIYHLASPASPPKYMKLAMETMMVNTQGTKTLLELSKRAKARLLFASTSETYGDPLVHPQTETYWGNVNPIGPRSVYDESKRFGETLVAHYQRSEMVDAVIVRIFNTYGPNMDPYDGRVISNFVRQSLMHEPLTIYGTGNQTRSFCYVSDLVRALMAAMESKETGPINLGNPVEFTLLELARLVDRVTGNESTILYKELPIDDPQQRKPDIKLAAKALNWLPTIGLEDGLIKTVDWMKQYIK